MILLRLLRGPLPIVTCLTLAIGALMLASDHAEAEQNKNVESPEMWQLKRDVSIVREVQRADGSVDVMLDGTFGTMSMQHIAPDGSIEMHCVQSAAGFQRVMDGNVTLPPATPVDR